MRVAWLSQDFWSSPLEERGQTPSICADVDDLPPFAEARGIIDDSESGLVEQGSWPTIDDAIAWARGHAPLVLARVGNSDYRSAGTVASQRFAPWPPDEHAIRSETARSG